MRRGAAPILAAAVLAAACRAPNAPERPPAYRVDPRSGLAGPFPAAVARGWEKMEARSWEEAFRFFASADGDAAAIGRAQALLELGRLPQARDECGKEFARGVETVAVLAVCGETSARQGDWVEAYDLFEAVVLRAPGSAGLVERRDAAGSHAVSLLVEKARGEEKSQAAEARADAERALAIAPANREALVVSGRAGIALKDDASALARLREAWKLDPSDTASGEEAAEAALRIGRGDAAFEIYAALARTDARFRERARRSEEDFVISNWPSPDREMALAPRLTRAGGAVLLWRLVPAIRTAASEARAPVASDILSRKDQKILSRCLQLGLLAVDPATHRARPDAYLSRTEAVRMLLRAAAVSGLPRGGECAGDGKAGPLAAAARCGLLPSAKSRGISGKEFRRGIAFLEGGRPAESAVPR